MQILGIVGKYPKRGLVKRAIQHITHPDKKLIKLKLRDIVIRIVASEKEMKLFSQKKERIIIKMPNLSIVWNPKNEHPLQIKRNSPGLTPLLYHNNKEMFVFSTNMLCITELMPDCEMNGQQVGQYLIRGYTTGKNAFIASINKLLVNSSIKLSRQRKLCLKTHTNECKSIEKNKSINELIVAFDYIFSKALKKTENVKHILCSGGLLSSIIVIRRNLMGIETIPLSVLFDDANAVCTDNIDMIKNVILEQKNNVNNNKQAVIHNEDIVKLNKRLFSKIDQPIGDIKIVMSNAILHKASEYADEIISGLGGSLYCCGYMNRYNRYVELQKNTEINAVSMNILHPEDVIKNSIAPDEDVNELLESLDIDILKAVQMFETHNYIPDFILYQNFICENNNNIDVKYPYFDKEVSDFLINLPQKYKIIDSYSNWFLRKYAEYIGVPQAIAWGDKHTPEIKIFKYLTYNENILDSELHKLFVDSFDFLETFEQRALLELLGKNIIPNYQVRYFYLLLLSIWQNNYSNAY